MPDYSLKIRRYNPESGQPAYWQQFDVDLPAVAPARPPAPRASDWMVGGVVLGEAILLSYFKLRSRLKNIRG